MLLPVGYRRNNQTPACRLRLTFCVTRQCDKPLAEWKPPALGGWAIPSSMRTACPLSGRNSTYHPVQILEAGSIYVIFATVTHRMP